MNNLIISILLYWMILRTNKEYIQCRLLLRKWMADKIDDEIFSIIGRTLNE